MRVAGLLMLFLVCTLASKAFAAAEGIGWIANWRQGLVEARKSNKPILLMAGMPACGGVPGVW